MQVQIDREDCISCGSCWEICPEVFAEYEDGFSSVVDAYRTAGGPGQGRIPDSLGPCARQAADGCPVEIIHIE